MQKGIVAFIILFIIMLILAYTATHSYFQQSISTTTIAHGASTTIAIQNSTTTIAMNYSQIGNCSDFSVYSYNALSAVTGKCAWKGGFIGLWVAAGNFGTERVSIIGANNVTYVKQISDYNCEAFYENITLPAQDYDVTLLTGSGGGSCGNAVATLNTTTAPPTTIWKFVYNGDFGTGTYGGWKVNGTGFGPGPLNITAASTANELCYIGQPWSGYNGTFFATTYNCGVSTSPGSITSSPFIVSPKKAFLNFRIISPEDSFLYVEVLENNTPEIISHYNTYNTSIDFNASSAFRNVSMDLSHISGKVLRIRVVASTSTSQHFIAVGDFALSAKPVEQPGVIANITYNYT
jgi:hypothetical protein